MNYSEFIDGKKFEERLIGFDPVWLPDCLFPFQRHLTDWLIRKGRGALLEDCGLGKTLQFLVYAENAIRKGVCKRALILSPIAVGPQIVREGEKFGVEVTHVRNGKKVRGINVTNYQQLNHYNPDDFQLVVGDESGAIKNFEGKTRKQVTEFFNKVKYAALCTATPAPNDHTELGTSAEALGVMGRNRMLGTFFVNGAESTQKWRLRGHARTQFWRWVGTWARAVRRPSDLGFADDGFDLPPLEIVHHKVKSTATEGFFPKLARTLDEQKAERRRTLHQRAELIASYLPKGKPCVVWCQLNAEGDLLEKLLPGAVQVAGADSDEEKETKLNDFARGNVQILVSKPSIAGFGLNWQHCGDVFYFPTHSHEQYYQAIRRCHRFGRVGRVRVNLVYSEAERLVVSNMLQKERRSEEMYEGIVKHMRDVLQERKSGIGKMKVRLPQWL